MHFSFPRIETYAFVTLSIDLSPKKYGVIVCPRESYQYEALLTQGTSSG